MNFDLAASKIMVSSVLNSSYLASLELFIVLMGQTVTGSDVQRHTPCTLCCNCRAHTHTHTSALNKLGVCACTDNYNYFSSHLFVTCPPSNEQVWFLKSLVI